MITRAVLLALGAALLAVPLLFLTGRGQVVRSLRILIHLVSFQAFGVAGWLVARDRLTWLGLLLVLFGFTWTGIFWIVSIRRRIVKNPVWAGEVGQRSGRQAPRNQADDEGGELEPRGRVILDRLIAMKELRVGHVATARERIVSADCSGGIGEVIERMRSSRYLRIPMTDGSLDRIIGVVHAKDVVPLALPQRRDRPLKTLMRRPLFISRDQTMSHLLELFRSQRGHLAIVVDEYNRTLGLVSRGDVFRHLSGGEEGGA